MPDLNSSLAGLKRLQVALNVLADKSGRTASKLFPPAARRTGSGKPAGKRSRRDIVTVLVRTLLFSLLPGAVLLHAIISAASTRTAEDHPRWFFPLDGRWESRMERGLPGVTIVTSCAASDGALCAAVKVGLAAAGVDQFVAVEWSVNSTSTSPAACDAKYRDPRVRLVRVKAEEAFSAARASNVGVGLASRELVGIVGCAMSDDWVGELRRVRTASGGDGRGEGEPTVWIFPSATFLRREAFRRVGGYSEADVLTSGSGDFRPDEDLALRLAEDPSEVVARFGAGSGEGNNDRVEGRFDQALPRRAFNEFYGVPEPLPTELSRMGWLRAKVYLSTLREHLLDYPLRPPSVYKVGRTARRSNASWKELLFSRGIFPSEIELLPEWRNRSRRLLEQTWSDAWAFAVGRELHDEFGTLWTLVDSLGFLQREQLWEMLLRSYAALRTETIALHGVGLSEDVLSDVQYRMPRLIVVHVMHGLGNRLRALASAMAFAELTGRQLVVVWERNAHCRARFSDVFELALRKTQFTDPSSEEGKVKRNIIVIDDFPLRWAQFSRAVYHDDAWKDWVAYNYMEMEGHAAKKDAPVVDDETKHIYFKSAYVLVSSGRTKVSWDLANVQLSKLEPVRAVRALVSAYRPSEHTVGVHVRSLALDREVGINSVREYGVDDSDVLSFWRSRSQPVAFYSEMRDILLKEPATRFFVASDSVEVVNDGKSRFPGKVDSLKIASCDDRDARCLQLALADMIILGSLKMVLGSPWSSFTEGAQRFGCKNVRHAGLDFSGPTHEEINAASPAVQVMLARVMSKRRKKSS